MTEKTFDQPKPGDVLAENVSFENFVQRYDGQSVEWHAGKVLQKVTNNTRHNFIQVFLNRLLLWFVETRAIGTVLTAGVPMYISDDVPAREPDLMVVLSEHEDRLTATHVEGPADVAIEIVSPTSGTIDRGDKFYEYQKAGVPEYWIIDPISEQIDIYTLNEKGVYQRVIGTDDKIVSKVLPGFVLEASILWQDKLPDGEAIVKLVQELTSSP